MAADAARRVPLVLRPRATKGVAVTLASVLLDILTAVLFLIVVPILVVLFVIACAVPAVNRLRHWRRDYLDGVAATFINHHHEAVIHSVIIYRERVATGMFFERFRDIYLGGGVPAFSNFLRRIVRPRWSWPYWEEPAVPFSTAYHFRSVTEPVSESELQAIVAKLQQELLDLERPPWQVWHFENFVDADGTQCSASLLRLHHACADGFAGMRILMQGASPNKPPAAPAEPRRDRRQSLSCLRLLRESFATLRKLVLLPQDRPSALKASALLHAGGPKVVAWSRLSNATVADLKHIGRRLGSATINDVLLAALSGALRDYALNLPPGAASLAEDATAVTWVSRAPLKHIYADFSEVPFEWGDKTLSACYLSMPVGSQRGSASAAETLFELKARTSDPALLVESVLVHRMLGLLGGCLPRVLGHHLWVLLGNKVSFSMSNVPGPQFQLDWCGTPVRDMLFLVPPTGTISLFVTIATWNGEVSVAMGMDGTLISQETLRSITGRRFEKQIADLARAAAEAS